MVIEDVWDIVSQLKNRWSLIKRKRQEYSEIDGVDSPTINTGGDNVEALGSGAENEKNEPSDLETEFGSHQNDSYIRELVEVKDGDHTKTGAEEVTPESSDLVTGVESDQNRSNTPEAVKVKNVESTSTEYLKLYRGWFIFKILATVVFFFSIFGFNAHMLRSLSN